MEVFKGNPQNPAFQEWLERLMRRRNIVAVAADEIPCHQARATLTRTSSLQHSFIIESLKEAIVHVITCKDQKCKQLCQVLGGQLKGP